MSRSNRRRKKKLRVSRSAVLTPEIIDACLHAASGTICEVEQQYANCLVIPADVARMPLR